MERAQPAQATVVVSCTTRPTSTRPAHNPKSKYAAVSESLNDKKNEKEIRSWLQKGAHNVQMDFTEGRSLTTKSMAQ